MKKIVENAKKLMEIQLEKNKAPNIYLIDIAIKKWVELAKIYWENEDIIVISIYLSHTIFNQDWDGAVQKNHQSLSAEFVNDYLDKWGVEKESKKIIMWAIKNHHNTYSNNTIEEIVRNAECFKFVSLEWALIRFYELWARWVEIKEWISKVFYKMKQKQSLLSLKECINEAEIEIKKIEELFNIIEIW